MDITQNPQPYPYNPFPQAKSQLETEINPPSINSSYSGNINNDKGLEELAKKAAYFFITLGFIAGAIFLIIGILGYPRTVFFIYLAVIILVIEGAYFILIKNIQKIWSRYILLLLNILGFIAILIDTKLNVIAIAAQLIPIIPFIAVSYFSFKNTE